MLTAFYNLGPPEQCLVIGALIAALYCLAFLLLHPLWIRQRIQNCNWRRYQKKILIARIGMIAIIVSTAIAARLPRKPQLEKNRHHCRTDRLLHSDALRTVPPEEKALKHARSKCSALRAELFYNVSFFMTFLTGNSGFARR